ncbi:MAG: hypothetical protein ACHQC9_06600, partial [Alphaproteobacteria bacterium]
PEGGTGVVAIPTPALAAPPNAEPPAPAPAAASPPVSPVPTQTLEAALPSAPPAPALALPPIGPAIEIGAPPTAPQSADSRLGAPIPLLPQATKPDGTENAEASSQPHKPAAPGPGSGGLY